MCENYGLGIDHKKFISHIPFIKESLYILQIGMGGAYHTWSPMFPDECGVLINTCDLTLGHRDTLPDGFIASDVWPDTQSKPGCIEEKTRIILHTRK